MNSTDQTTHVIPTLEVGNAVEKTGGDYTFAGQVVAVFTKLSGKIRYVVEDDRGILHIFSRANLVWKEKPTIGLEPMTDGLQNHCSTTELSRREGEVRS